MAFGMELSHISRQRECPRQHLSICLVCVCMMLLRVVEYKKRVVVVFVNWKCRPIALLPSCVCVCVSKIYRLSTYMYSFFCCYCTFIIMFLLSHSASTCHFSPATLCLLSIFLGFHAWLASFCIAMFVYKYLLFLFLYILFFIFHVKYFHLRTLDVCLTDSWHTLLLSSKKYTNENSSNTDHSLCQSTSCHKCKRTLWML